MSLLLSGTVTRNCITFAICGWSNPGRSPSGKGTGASFVTVTFLPPNRVKSTMMSARSPGAMKTVSTLTGPWR